MEINWITVVVAAVAQMVIGMAWYSKSLFGTQWASEMGFKLDDPKMKQGMGKMMAVGFVMAIVMAYVLSLTVNAFGVSSITGGASTGIWMWLGFVLPLLVGGILWEKKSQRLLTINAGYWLVVLAVMGGIIAGM